MDSKKEITTFPCKKTSITRPVFQVFCSIGQENAFYDILERKNNFLGYKNNNFKKSKNWHFSKGVSPRFSCKIDHFPTLLF